MLSAVIVILWLSLIFYWIVSARGNKKTKYKKTAVSGWNFRGILIIIFILLWNIPYFSFKFFYPNTAVKIIGVLFCALGIAFAIWARHTLGKNWSSNLEIKEGHELIISGPYKLVRHPIYTGVIFALLGTFIEEASLRILILLVLIALGMYMRSKIEEGLMLKQFPEEYSGYKNKTKALIPWIF